MNFKEMLLKNPFTLVVSLPSNDIELAQAAIDGGAQAIKVHCNVWHRASNQTFGSYAENKNFLKELIQISKSVPVGLVPGGEDAFVCAEERLELEDMGLSFFSSYIHHLPCHMLESKVLTKMAAIDNSYNDTSLACIAKSKIDVLECSIKPGTCYGNLLTYADILQYEDIVQKSHKPCLIPTQLAINPSEVTYLAEVGCKALMIGAIVMGKTPSVESVRTTCADFRRAIDSL